VGDLPDGEPLSDSILDTVVEPACPNSSIVRDVVAERLLPWERDRQNRWRKALELLVRS
jgi:hypothetical protein